MTKNFGTKKVHLTTTIMLKSSTRTTIRLQKEQEVRIISQSIQGEIAAEMKEMKRSSKEKIHNVDIDLIEKVIDHLDKGATKMMKVGQLVGIILLIERSIINQ